MWIKSEIVDDVDRVARVWFISREMAQGWNTKRREGELRMMTGWVWTSRDGKQERVAFRTMTAAYIDAHYTLVARAAAPRLARPRVLRVAEPVAIRGAA
jgi:hypothetical protein